MKDFSVEDLAWDIYVNGMKSKWSDDRVKSRKDFPKCDEYREYMEMAKDVYDKITIQ